MNRYRPKLQLKVVSRDDSSVSTSCQYPLEQSTTVIAVAPASFEDSSSGTMYLYGSRITALFRLLGSRQMRSLGLPSLSVVSTWSRILLGGLSL